MSILRTNPFSESQLTLASLSESTTKLQFQTWQHILSTDIVELPSEKLIYTTKTNDAAFAHTVISDASGATLAIINRSTSSVSKTSGFVAIGDGDAVKIKHWLKEELLENGGAKWTIITPFGNAVWMQNSNLQFVFYLESEPDSPLAWVQVPENEVYVPFTLTLLKGTDWLHSHILTSFVILESRARMRKKKSRNQRKRD